MIVPKICDEPKSSRMADNDGSEIPYRGFARLMANLFNQKMAVEHSHATMETIYCASSTLHSEPKINHLFCHSRHDNLYDEVE